jgi:nicotinamidase-related amidase
MPITTIDDRTALIVIDLQRGIVAFPLAHPVAGVLANARALAAAFRRQQLPVVLVNVTGGAPGRAEQTRGGGPPAADWAVLVPEVDQQPSDHVVTKQTWGAFSKTNLAGYLKDQGVTQVVVIGVATSFGVESTARQAHELGFNVAFAVDAMTDMNADAHINSVTRIFPRLGETGTTQDIIQRLDARAAG